MGVLPLQFAAGEGWRRGGLDGTEAYDITGVHEGLGPGGRATLVATSTDGTQRRFSLTARLDSPTEVTYYRHGGIIPYILRRLLREVAARES